MTTRRCVLAVSAILSLFLGACGQSEAPVSYKADVQPILDNHCLDCHQPGSEGYRQSGLSVQTYEDLMQGTNFGPILVPGDAFNSNLNILVEGRADPSITMPHGDQKLYAGDLETLKVWVDQGATNN
jgi:hypothetical protein